MNKHVLKEDRRLLKLPIVCSYQVYSFINDVSFRNQDKVEEIARFKEDISCILDHISNPVIAWNNAARYIYDDNGTIFFEDFGFKVDFMVMTDKVTQQNYIRVIYLEFNLEDFGLQENKRQNSKFTISESQLRNIITESIRKVLYN